MLLIALFACDVPEALHHVEDALTAGYPAVGDLAFSELARGRVDRGAVTLDWTLMSRDLGWTTFDMERGIPGSLRRIDEVVAEKGWDTNSCRATEVVIYEVESSFANQSDRFQLEERPGPNEVLAGLYDPRPFVGGKSAIVLTEAESPMHRRTLLAHELAHLAHDVCGFPGDSETFAEEVEERMKELPAVARGEGARKRGEGVRGERPDGDEPVRRPLGKRPGQDGGERAHAGRGHVGDDGPPRRARRGHATEDATELSDQ